MNTKLIMVEGLPGSGKSTIAQFVAEILAEKGIEARLFQEGDLEHPADYEGAAFYTQDEFNRLLAEHQEFKGMLESGAIQHGSDFLIPYQKMKNEFGSDAAQELLQEIAAKDMYELPFDQNVKLITERWNHFKKDILHDPVVHIFECCFIQNPLTIGTVKYNVEKTQVMNYVLQLEEIIKPLNPLLIYIDRQDIKSTFEKAVQERPKEWSDGFIQYYTGQGLGQAEGYRGLEGAVQVLRERKKIELEIFDLLEINKRKIDNSHYDKERCKEEIRKMV